MYLAALFTVSQKMPVKASHIINSKQLVVQYIHDSSIMYVSRVPCTLVTSYPFDNERESKHTLLILNPGVVQRLLPLGRLPDIFLWIVSLTFVTPHLVPYHLTCICTLHLSLLARTVQFIPLSCLAERKQGFLSPKQVLNKCLSKESLNECVS